MGIDGYAVLIFTGLALVLCMFVGVIDDKKNSDKANK